MGIWRNSTVSECRSAGLASHDVYFNCPSKSDTPTADNGQQTEDPPVFCLFLLLKVSGFWNNYKANGRKPSLGFTNPLPHHKFKWHFSQFIVFSALQTSQRSFECLWEVSHTFLTQKVKGCSCHLLSLFGPHVHKGRRQGISYFYTFLILRALLLSLSSPHL